jgi:hypothetical protein
VYQNNLALTDILDTPREFVAQIDNIVAPYA